MTGIMYVLNIWHVQAVQLFSVAGVILAIWGLFEKNENVMKRMVFGVGLLICGMLGAWSYYIEIMRFTPQQPVYYLRYFYLDVVVIMFFAIGIALNIWAFFYREKKVAPTGFCYTATLATLKCGKYRKCRSVAVFGRSYKITLSMGFGSSQEQSRPPRCQRHHA
jgi:hypothetical protein